MPVQEKTVFVSSDGVQHPTREAAEHHERVRDLIKVIGEFRDEDGDRLAEFRSPNTLETIARGLLSTYALIPLGNDNPYDRLALVLRILSGLDGRMNLDTCQATTGPRNDILGYIKKWADTAFSTTK